MKKALLLCVECQKLKYTPQGFFLFENFPKNRHKNHPVAVENKGLEGYRKTDFCVEVMPKV
jgi:hypothetical protein